MKDAQNYYVFGLCQSPGILKARRQYVLTAAPTRILCFHQSSPGNESHSTQELWQSHRSAHSKYHTEIKSTNHTWSLPMLTSCINLNVTVTQLIWNWTDKGMVRSDMSIPALIFFFTTRVHTTKSTVKILAANTHCKYFLKTAEFTHFFCMRNRLYQRFVQPFVPSHVSTVATFTLAESAVLRVAYCFALPRLC
jgi:hypothetical protein